MTRRGGSGAGGGGGLDLPPWPKIDFAKFGPVEAKPLAANPEALGGEPLAQLGDDPARHAVRRGGHHRPRAFRVALNEEHAKDGVKVTILAFLVKACVAALKQFPDLNASLDGDQLVLKRYYHSASRPTRRTGSSSR